MIVISKPDKWMGDVIRTFSTILWLSGMILPPFIHKLGRIHRP